MRPSPPVLVDSFKLVAPLENAGHDCPELTPHGGTTHTETSATPSGKEAGAWVNRNPAQETIQQLKLHCCCCFCCYYSPARW